MKEIIGSRRGLGWGVSLLALCAFSGEALASGFALREQSAEGLGDAFAGQTAKAYNASTVFYNPAGMARLREDEVAGTVTWISPDSVFHGSNSSPLGGSVRGTTGDNAIKPAAVGSVFGVWTVSPDWRIGLSLATPYGMRSEYKENWVGRYQALASDLTDYEAALVASYKVNDHLSLGGGPRFDYINARLSQAVNFNGIGLAAASQLGALATATRSATLGAQAAGLQSLANGWGDGQAKVEGDDYGAGYSFSGLYEPDSSTRFGLNYRSRIVHQLDGNVAYQTPTNLAAAGSALSTPFTNRNVTAKITLPDSLAFGAYHDIDSRWAVLSDVSWTHWSLFKSLNVIDSNGGAVSSTAEHWHNSWFVSLGTNYKATDRLTLHGGVAFDQTPVTDTYRTARIPDSNRYWTAVGASYVLASNSDLHFSYAHLFADSANINESATTSSVGGTLNGTYKNNVDILSASFTLRF